MGAVLPQLWTGPWSPAWGHLLLSGCRASLLTIRGPGNGRSLEKRVIAFLSTLGLARVVQVPAVLPEPQKAWLEGLLGSAGPGLH